MLRSHELLLESLEFKDKINDIVFVGHSLGGACSIIAAAKLKYDKIRGVAVMSPEVREMQKTPVNDDIWLLNGDADSIKAAMAFFRDEFPKDTQLAIISSKRDNISLPDDNKRLFVVATESRQDEDVALFSIDGNHFGYEDELDLPNQINLEGAQGSIGPIKFSLAPLTRPLKSLINIVNKTAVRLFEWVQYDAYWLSSVIVSAIGTSRFILGQSCLASTPQFAHSSAHQHQLLQKRLWLSYRHAYLAPTNAVLLRSHNQHSQMHGGFERQQAPVHHVLPTS
eukprot:GHRR01004922.1.p1 GENE.GHRR01004922.1~~GHRR01004922.1.p1  ORF type:complete len:282 (+),score=70.89 GHRR01004922.1:275-1120(+)